jgi:hypothetical protein
VCAVWCSLPDSMALSASTACTRSAEGDRTSWRSRADLIGREGSRGRGRGGETEMEGIWVENKGRGRKVGRMVREGRVERETR